MIKIDGARARARESTDALYISALYQRRACYRGEVASAIVKCVKDSTFGRS